MMQSYDFGVLPYRLFSQKFPENKKTFEKNKNLIYNFIRKQFNKDHIECLIDEKVSFICKGEKGINKELSPKKN